MNASAVSGVWTVLPLMRSREIGRKKREVEKCKQENIIIMDKCFQQTMWVVGEMCSNLGRCGTMCKQSALYVSRTGKGTPSWASSLCLGQRA